MTIDLTAMRDDMRVFLEDWGESLSYSRSSVGYDAMGQASLSWSSNTVILGDYQPLSGKEIEAEAGLEQKSDAKIECYHDVTVIANDRIIRNGVTWRVNYVKDYEEHAIVYIYREVNP